jgi:hypothetical protein
VRFFGRHVAADLGLAGLIDGGLEAIVPYFSLTGRL